MLRYFVRIVFRLSLIRTAFLFISQSGSFVIADPSSKIEPELSALLDQGNRANVIVSFQKGIKSTLDGWSTTVRTGDRGMRNKALKDALQKNADDSQATVVHMLSTRRSGGDGFKYFKSFWTGNKLFIREASADVIKQIAADPEVAKITKEPIMNFPSDEETETELKMNFNEEVVRGARGKPDDQKISWGLKNVQAFEAWEELGGKRGEGVIVASIDSGVRYTHEALRDNFVGVDYGWYDGYENKSLQPRWGNRHGTHVMGSIVGSKDTGIAPGARWMTCMACDYGYCPGEALLECMQWLSCPTLPDGTKEDCSKAPHIINNSWDSRPGVDDFDEIILQWRSLGIIPVFAIGNSRTPSYCQSTRTPGDKKFVIGVGALNFHNMHYPGSAIGPAPDGTIKPDILAPGVSILSATVLADDSYWWSSGTSQASPHVAGVVALLKVRQPEMTYDQVYEIITKNANTKNISLHLPSKDKYCNESSSDVIPNVFFGYGGINALQAVKAQTVALGKS